MAEDESSFLTSLHVNLRDKNNGSYRGQLMLKNWTLWYGEDGTLNAGPNPDYPDDQSIEDPTGASYYVIAVVLVYGMSIVMLIASHINRKHTKLVEDRQIHKYLQEFQIVKERSSQESYKDLKRKIKEQIQWDKEHNKNKYLQKNLSHAVLPMIAVTFPSITEAQSLTSIGMTGDVPPRSRASSISRVSTASPVSQPRSRANSFGESLPRHGRYLQLPEPADITGSPRLSRDRKKGLLNALPNFPSQGAETHHLEKILEESLDSRHSSFNRKNSKKSVKSSSLSSVSESQKYALLEQADMSRRASDTCNSIANLDIAENPDPNAPNSPDSGMSNNSNPNTDVKIYVPEISDSQEASSDEEHYTPQDYLRLAHISEGDSVWVLNSDLNSDDEEQRDEAYVSGRYSANGFLKASPIASVHSYSNRNNSPKSSEHLIPKRHLPCSSKRLSPLYDESEYYSESSSESEDDGLLHITCV